MADIYVNTGTTFQQPYNARQPAIGSVPANAQIPARQPRNAQNPFTYQNRQPFTYRNPVSGQQPYIANAQQPYPYIANAQQPYIANSQTPFTYQNRQPVNGQNPYIANAQQPYIANARQPFTYQARYPANAQQPYIANARNPFTYQAQNPFTYQARYPANAQTPYIANAQQPYIANARQPSIVQVVYQAPASYQIPFTYQVTYNATGRTPAIGTAQGSSTVTVSDTYNQTSTGVSLWAYTSGYSAGTINSALYVNIKLVLSSTTFSFQAKFWTPTVTNRSKPSWATWSAYYTMFYGTVSSSPNSFKLICTRSNTVETTGGTAVGAFGAPVGNSDATNNIDGSTTSYTWPSASTSYGYIIGGGISQNGGGMATNYCSADHQLRLNKTGFPEYTFSSVDTDFEVLATNTYGGGDPSGGYG